MRRLPGGEQDHTRIVLTLLAAACIVDWWLFPLMANFNSSRVPLSMLHAALSAALVGIAILPLAVFEIEPLHCMFVTTCAGAAVAPILPLLAHLVFPNGIWPAAVFEELGKAAVVFGIYWAFRTEIDRPVDAMVYSLLVAAGFGFTENTIYFAAKTTFPLDEFTVAWPLFFRMMAMAGHVAFTGWTGIGLAYWMKSKGLEGRGRHKTKRKPAHWALVAGLAVAMLVHYWWDATTRSGPEMLVLRWVPALVVIAVGWVLFRSHEADLIEEHIKHCPAVAPCIEGDQVDIASPGRHLEILLQRLTPPWNKECRDRYTHFRAISQLAFLRRNVRRGALTLDPWVKAKERKLIDRICATCDQPGRSDLFHRHR